MDLLPPLSKTLGSTLKMATEAQAAGAAAAGTSTLEAVVTAAHDTAGAFSTLERQLRHSRSFHDVQAVDAGHALSPPPLKRIKKSEHSQTLLETSLKAVQEDENEVAEVVVVCEPEGGVLFLGTSRNCRLASVTRSTVSDQWAARRPAAVSTISSRVCVCDCMCYAFSETGCRFVEPAACH